MELFIPSVLLLLLAAATIFFVLPRFGAATLAVISIVLLGFGIYQHMNSFGSEYRMSGAPLGIMTYAPYIMVGGVLVVIALYLINLSPLGKANATAPTLPEVPTVAEMPPANTATNSLTAGVNNALKGITNAAAAATAVGNVAKNNANKGILGAITNVANRAKEVVNNTLTGSNGKNNTGGLAGALGFGNEKPTNNNRGTRVPGLNFPLSQV